MVSTIRLSTSKSSKSLDHVSIKTHGDLGMSHFQKHTYIYIYILYYILYIIYYILYIIYYILYIIYYILYIIYYILYIIYYISYIIYYILYIIYYIIYYILYCIYTNYIHGVTWVLPEIIGVPLNHPFLDGIFHSKPCIFGMPPLMETPSESRVFLSDQGSASNHPLEHIGTDRK